MLSAIFFVHFPLAKHSQWKELGKTTWQNALSGKSWAKPRGKVLSAINVGQNHAAKCSPRYKLGKTTWQNTLTTNMYLLFTSS